MQEASKILSRICLHGHVIKNPYTGVSVYTPCGTCPTCRYNQSKVNTLKVYAEEQVKKYCYFGSLSYSAKYVPRYTITAVDSNDDMGTFLATPIHRKPLHASRTIIKGSKRITKSYLVKGLDNCEDIEPFYFTAKKAYVDDYCAKANCGVVNGQLKYPEYDKTYGFINWYDLSLFMKRLRKLINKYNIDEKISCYLVAEYGPKTFRPHFHFLFFFNSDQLASCIRQIVSACWKFGRVDCSASRGHASSYVAEYTNSFSRIPQHLLDNKQFRSRGRFSNNFNFQFFKPAIAKALQGDFSSFLDGVDVVRHDRLLKLFASPSVVHSCFIPYASDNSKSVSDLYDLCVSAHGLYHRFRGSTDFGTARLTYDYFSKLSNSELYENLNHSKDFYTNVIVDHLRFVDHSLDFDDAELCIGRFYNLYRSVSRFFNTNGLSFYSKTLDRHKLYCALEMSKKFYIKRDYENLKTTFELIQDCGDSRLLNIISQTEEKNEELINSDIGIQSRYEIKRLIDMSIKHREINDANLCFTNMYLYNG